MIGRHRKLLLAVAATLLVAAPSAHAAQSPPQRWPIDGPALQQARQIAVDHWAINPCNGDVAITWAQLAPDENGRATWVNPFHDYGDPAGNTKCAVALNTRQDWTWPKLCTVLTHEFGHLAGNAHSDDPHNVMYAYYTGTNLPACEAVSPAASPAPTAPPQGRQTPAAKRASRSKAYRAGTTRRPKRPGSRTRQR